MRFKDHAICIRHLDWSETSQIVALLTREHGKVRGLAKGSRRTSKSSVQRYSGGIDLLTRGEIVGIIKPSTDLATLTEWDLQEPFRHLHADLSAQWIAMYAADVVNSLMADHDPHPVTFEELGVLLGSLGNAAKPQAALARFQWRMLEDLGYKPEVEVDAASGSALPAAAAYTFDARAGGVTAQSAAFTGGATGVGPWRVRRETVELLRGLAKGETASGEAAARRANRLLCVYIRAILDRPLPTMDYILGGGE
jgi:DNA repair protein RecO (recombination protein O)